jgi:hypothetical protein
MMVLKGILQNKVGERGIMSHLAQDRNKLLDFVYTTTNRLAL